MTRTIRILALAALAVAAGCGDDTSNNGNDMGSGGGGGGGNGGFPAAPALGAQIDRMGRPGVNTALTDPFWDSKGDGTTGLDAHHAKQDAYNQALPADWGKFTAAIKGALGVYDALDQDLVTGNMACGNQLAYGVLAMPDYTALATVLTDDELYVNSNNGTCQAYLGVEAATLGQANSDCGGRTPTENTIDVTYAALASAAVLGTKPLPNLNGVAADADGNANIGSFPFLGAPNNN